MANPYLELTEALNQGRPRALVSSGQAVVMHRLAIMSKDGDWILREDQEALDHALRVLAGRGATYRFGAPLDLRWLAGGWSSHLEHRRDGLRLRTDFVTRPPRVDADTLAQLWQRCEETGDPVVGLEALAAIKLTNREKDYAVVGELARRMNEPLAQMLYSRSSRDLIALSRSHPETWARALEARAALAVAESGREALDEALDRERRGLMRINEERLARYRLAAEAWSARWPAVVSRMASLPLTEAHLLMVQEAEGILPYAPLAGDAS